MSHLAKLMSSFNISKVSTAHLSTLSQHLVYQTTKIQVDKIWPNPINYNFHRLSQTLRICAASSVQICGSPNPPAEGVILAKQQGGLGIHGGGVMMGAILPFAQLSQRKEPVNFVPRMLSCIQSMP